MLVAIEAVLPTFIAIIALVTFTPKTRWLSYTVVVLAMLSELIPLQIHMTGLLATSSVFIGLLILELLRARNIAAPFFATHEASK